MPLYEYECDACGHRFEQIRKFSDPPLEACPKCGGRVRKLVSSPAFQFKGSGFYATDYARKGDTGKSTDSKDSGSKETSASETKASSDSKDSSGSKASSDASAAGSSSTSTPASTTAEKPSKAS